MRALLRQLNAREPAPSASIVDSRTLSSTWESGGRAGYDRAKKRNGSKIHIAVDTLGHLLALSVTAADEGDRNQGDELCEQVQKVTGENVELMWVDQGYTGENAANAAQKHGVVLRFVKLPHSQAWQGAVASALGGGAFRVMCGDTVAPYRVILSHYFPLVISRRVLP